MYAHFYHQKLYSGYSQLNSMPYGVKRYSVNKKIKTMKSEIDEVAMK
jgi:uncharacterized protein YycO